MRITKCSLGLFLVAIPFVAAANGVVDACTQQSVQDTGVSAIWVLSNVSYAGMRAQNSPSSGWRIVAFIFGFPGTLLSYLVVPEGGEKAYGIDIPKKR